MMYAVRSSGFRFIYVWCRENIRVLYIIIPKEINSRTAETGGEGLDNPKISRTAKERDRNSGGKKKKKKPCPGIISLAKYQKEPQNQEPQVKWSNIQVEYSISFPAL